MCPREFQASRSAEAAVAGDCMHPEARRSTWPTRNRPPWAEWYRYLAERGKAPNGDLPRDLYRIAVDLSAVVDLSSASNRKEAGVPARMRPTSAQWPAFQPTAERLAATGAAGVLYGSAARTRSLCLCVFETGLPGLRVAGQPVRVIAPPPPPRGLRT